MPVPALLPVETVLRSRYKIIEFISQGGMGAIYKAEDLRLEGRMCAVKEMETDVSPLPGGLEQVQVQFHREASILARLDHPNLPKVSDYFAEGQRDYLVMDFVPGKDLKELMDEAQSRDETISEEQVLSWAGQILDALEYLHTQEPPVLHRDIKPANIKLAPSGTIKLVDFGLVKLMAPDEERTVTVLQGRGTAQYTPLEQYGGDTGHTDVRSDIYSLGSTLYHLLTNHPPLNAKSRFLEPHLFRPPRQLNAGVSPRVERALLRAMAMHPDERPSSVAELRSDLLPSSPFASAPGYGPLAVEPFPWRRALRANGILILVILVLLIIALLATAFSPYEPAVSLLRAMPEPVRVGLRTRTMVFRIVAALRGV